MNISKSLLLYQFSIALNNVITSNVNVPAITAHFQKTKVMYCILLTLYGDLSKVGDKNNISIWITKDILSSGKTDVLHGNYKYARGRQVHKDFCDLLLLTEIELYKVYDSLVMIHVPFWHTFITISEFYLFFLPSLIIVLSSYTSMVQCSSMSSTHSKLI